MIQSGDIYVLTGLIAWESGEWTLRELADGLMVDHTLVHRALKRAESVGLYSSATRRVNLPNLEELLIHASRFVLPAKLGEVTVGVPSAWAAKPIVNFIHESDTNLPPVWPTADGDVRGQALAPLHPSAPLAINRIPRLGDLLSIVDSLRAGDIRIRDVATKAIREYFLDAALGSAA